MWLREVIFSFFQKNPSLKKILFEGVKVREDWLVQVNLFYKESKSEKTEKNISSVSFFLGGGGCWVSELF